LLAFASDAGEFFMANGNAMQVAPLQAIALVMWI
jgi:hypothetical protein